MKEWNIEGGALQYEEHGGEVTIVGASALLVFVEVPPKIEGKPVTGIDKKAFLSKKYIKRVTLPAGIRTIGDWAFAYCDRLEEVIMPDREILFGKTVFLEDRAIRSLTILGRPKGHGHLLAAAIRLMQAEYLLSIPETGTEEWLAKWDSKMLAILEEDDAEGYSGQVLCGEEDYGSTDFGAYQNRRRRRKVSILLERLLWDDMLGETIRRRLIDYLMAHTKGCPTEETWQVILNDHSMDRDYYSMFVSLGFLNKENKAACIADMGEDAPEMKAFLLTQFEEEKKVDAFFAGFDL